MGEKVFENEQLLKDYYINMTLQIEKKLLVSELSPSEFFKTLTKEEQSFVNEFGLAALL